MWKDYSSIQTKILKKMTYILLISIGVWCFIWIQGEYSAFESESDLLRSAYIQSQKSGVDLDTIEEKIAENRETLIIGLKKRVARSVVVLAGLLLLVYFWSRRISNQIQRSILVFSSFLEEARTDSALIDLDKIQLKEFKDIAVSTNKMLEDRRKANEKLRKSEEKFREIFNTSPDSINLNRLESGKYLDINEGFTNLTGYSREDVIGKTSQEINIWNDLKDIDRLVAGVKKDGIVKNLEAVFKTKDGQTVIGLMSACLLNIDDKPVILSVTNDITHREQMLTDHKRFLTAIEQLAESIVITDIQGRIEYVNPAFEKITGYSSEEAFNQNPRLLKSGEHDQFFYHTLWETITSGKTWKGRMINKKKNGTFYSEESTISPVFDKTGGIINFVAVKRDITDEIQMEKRLQQSQKMEAIGTLAGGIAHDFNNILFPILGHTEILIEDSPPEGPLRDSLNEIYTNALRAKDLVRQILTFSRQKNNELKAMKMQPIIEEALKMLRSTVPTTIEITSHLDRECGFIKADPTQIHQIIMNLATNAYHAMEDDGGKLIIELKSIDLGKYDLINPDMLAGSYVCLSVKDTGKGISKQTIKKIFDPFFTTKEPGKGTGMGLSVVHGIIKNMKGATQVNSQPGKGTEFYVYLPIVKDALETQAPKTNKPIIGGSEQILLVDDEQGIITMVKTALERLGYRVTAYTNSIKALEAFKNSSDKFDLTITNMTMPNMPGDKLAVELIKVRPDIPIFICTGFSGALTQERIKSLGIKGLLLKPISIKDLAEKIREALDE